jgi:hypothetical protein
VIFFRKTHRKLDRILGEVSALRKENAIMSQSLDTLKSSVAKLAQQVDVTLSHQNGAASDADLAEVTGVVDALTAKLAAGTTEPAPPPAP